MEYILPTTTPSRERKKRESGRTLVLDHQRPAASLQTEKLRVARLQHFHDSGEVCKARACRGHAPQR